MKLKIILSIVLVVVVSLSAVSQEKYYDNDSKKYGYKDASGTTVIAPKFDNAWNFSEDVALVKLNGKYGYIDKKGKFVIQPQFESAGDFSEDIAEVKLNGKYGYIDKKGIFAIQPQFDYAWNFSEDIAVVELNGKWGYIDKKGTFVIQPQFDDARDFSEDIARVELNGKWGYIDKKGTFVIQPQFDDAWNFSEDIAKVKLNGKWGYVDKKGTFVIQPQFDDAESFSEDVAAVMLNGKWGYVDKKGTLVIQPQFEGARNFSEDVAVVILNGKYGYIDKNGTIVIQPQFEGVWKFSEDVAVVKLNGKYGYIDKNGTIVIQPQFDDAWNFSEDIAKVELNGKGGYIDKKGNYYDSKAKAQFALKQKQPLPGESYATYINRVAGSLEGYIARQHLTKPTIADAADIKQQVEREINAWQIKGEFETTAQWQQRVNETTRNEKIKDITARILSENNRKVENYNTKLADCRKEYEAQVRQASIGFCLSRAASFSNQQFELKPYDADNQTFLISTQTAGDILLPVPLAKAQTFKQNWSSIKREVKAEYVPVGDDVALKSVSFGEYTYDSNTKADYAVTTVDYNFKPIEISEVELAAVDYKFDNISSEPAMTVSNPEVKTVTTTKVTPKQNKVTVGTASDVDLNIPAGAARSINTFAIVIANENYKNVEPVANAANDGKVVAQYLSSTLSIPQNQIYSYTNASYGEIIAGLDKIKNIAKAYQGSDFEVIFYYAGHGVPDEQSKEAYILPIDGIVGNTSVSIPLGKLYDTLGNLGASSVLVMLDACFSGSQRGDGMLAQARGVAIKTKAAEPKGNMIVLSAAGGDETAYPYKAKSHGLFTYFLLKKLQDTKGDVTIGDLADYIIDNVRKTSVIENDGKIQTPTVRASQSTADSWRNQKIIK